MSGRSSSSEPVAPDLSAENCTFLDECTLKLQHYGPRALMLGDFAYSFQPKSLRGRKDAATKSIDFSTQSLSLSSSFIPQMNNSSVPQRASSRRRVIRSSRPSRTESVAAKFGFSGEDEDTYQEFARLLSNFEPEEMFDIIADVLKEAKKTQAG